MNYLGVYAMLSIASSFLVFVLVSCEWVRKGRVKKIKLMMPVVLFFAPLIVPIAAALDMLKERSLEWYITAFAFYLAGVALGVFISN